MEYVFLNSIVALSYWWQCDYFQTDFTYCLGFDEYWNKTLKIICSLSSKTKSYRGYDY